LGQRVFTFLNSIILMRELGGNVYGMFLLYVAYLNIIPTVINSLDVSISRFFPTLRREDSKELTAAIFVIKFYVGLLSSIIFFFATPSSLEVTHTSSFWVELFACCFIIPLFQPFFNRYLTASGVYNVVPIIDTLSSATLFFGLLIISIYSPHQLTLNGYILLFLVTSLFALLIKMFVSRIFIGSFLDFSSLFSLSKSVKLISRREYSHYYGSFFLTSISGYFKDQLPLLFIGMHGRGVEVSEFRIVQQLFRVVPSIVSNPFELIRPQLVKAHIQNKKSFLVDYHRYSYRYLIFSFLISFILVSLSPFILSLWGIKTSLTLVLVSLILGIELIVAASLQIEFQIYMLRDSTWYLAIMSISRQILTLFLIWLLSELAGAVGVALSILMATVYVYFGYYFHARKSDIRPLFVIDQILKLTLVLCCLELLAFSIPYFFIL
jgi:O-antigen/teichoic acid export membrane protein